MIDNLRQLSVVIYRLKRKYGKRIIIRKIDYNDRDITTGQITQVENDIIISKAVPLPNKMKRAFSYDLSYVAASKNFTYGGIFEVGERKILIDAKDIPSDYTLKNTDTIIFEERRYEIKEIEDLQYAYLLRIKDIKMTEGVEDGH